MQVIGIVGSRRRDTEEDYAKLLHEFSKVAGFDDIIVSGGCYKGGDRFAERIVKQQGRTIIIHYPDWDTYGRGAGFVRNTKIAEDCDVLLALVAPDRKGGTEDTVKKAMKMGKQIILVE